ncbi:MULTISPECIES: glutathione transferase GstA [Ramlibacter]|uniref:Glutathione transferase GstA n=1 Tax=Ramlibacter aquaticus TaxID=2780094 RepID=A0ABR9SF47_9BURK|nr:MULTISPECIES: glutathione transferase GstA [Ramlibacter]MBE7940986.1 glutathione transferase GstA [Ramlibacter aquaticus]
MKLYYSPGACSLSPHIVLREAGLAFEPVLAPTKTKKLPDGSDYTAVNPLGYVPLLEMDDGARLREGPAIIQYVADQAPHKNLAPANGTLQRYRLQEWLTFIGTELHKTYSPLFNPAFSDDTKKFFKDKLASRYQWVEKELAGKDYVMGDHFTVADAYLFTVTRWGKAMKLDFGATPHLDAWMARVAARPAVQEALKAEGQA